jgi:hypothetical protein
MFMSNIFLNLAIPRMEKRALGSTNLVAPEKIGTSCTIAVFT